MSTQKNDDTILKLKEVIESKKAKIKSMSTTFSPKTNCSYKGMNLHVVKEKDLLIILREILTLQKLDDEIKGMDFGFKNEDFLIQNFSADDWLHDIKARMDILSIRTQKEQLNKMEKRLETLLSTEKKVELELAEIMKDLT